MASRFDDFISQGQEQQQALPPPISSPKSPRFAEFMAEKTRVPGMPKRRLPPGLEGPPDDTSLGGTLGRAFSSAADAQRMESEAVGEQTRENSPIEGVPMMYSGAKKILFKDSQPSLANFTAAQDPMQRFEGANEVIGGAGKSLTPLAAAAGVGAPVETILGLGAGMGVQKATEWGLNKLGVRGPVSEFVGNVAGLMPVLKAGHMVWEKVHPSDAAATGHAGVDTPSRDVEMPQLPSKPVGSTLPTEHYGVGRAGVPKPPAPTMLPEQLRALARVERNPAKHAALVREAQAQGIDLGTPEGAQSPAAASAEVLFGGRPEDVSYKQQHLEDLRRQEAESQAAGQTAGQGRVEMPQLPQKSPAEASADVFNQSFSPEEAEHYKQQHLEDLRQQEANAKLQAAMEAEYQRQTAQIAPPMPPAEASARVFMEGMGGPDPRLAEDLRRQEAEAKAEAEAMTERPAPSPPPPSTPTISPAELSAGVFRQGMESHDPRLAEDLRRQEVESQQTPPSPAEASAEVFRQGMEGHDPRLAEDLRRQETESQQPPPPPPTQNELPDFNRRVAMPQLPRTAPAGEGPGPGQTPEAPPQAPPPAGFIPPKLGPEPPARSMEPDKNNVAESKETLHTQIGQLIDGVRRAVLLPPESGITLPPEGMKKKSIKGVGTFFYNPNHPNKITGPDISAAVRDGRLNEILGAADRGMGPANKPEAMRNPNEPPVGVVARSPNGVEVQGTLSDQANLRQTIEQTQKVTPPGGTVTIEDPEKVIAERQQANRVENGNEPSNGITPEGVRPPPPVEKPPAIEQVAGSTIHPEEQQEGAEGAPPDDSQNPNRLPGNVGVRQEPLEAQPQQGAGGEAPGAGGVLQEQGQAGVEAQPAVAPTAGTAPLSAGSLLAQGARNLFGNTSGAFTPQGAIAPLSNFAQRDVIPAAQAALDTTKAMWDGVTKTFAPQTRDAMAKDVSLNIRERAAEAALAKDRATFALKSAREHFSQQPEQYSRDFIARMEGGQPQPTPELQIYADTLRKILDDRRDAIRALGTGKLKNFIVNYFPHSWKDPTLAAQKMASYVAKRPLEGMKKFLMKRTIPTIQEGIDMGLIPTTLNPVDLTLQKAFEMDKYLMGQKIMSEMKSKGQLKFFRPYQVREAKQNGYVMIDDRLSTVYGKSKAGELVVRGNYMAPERAAQVLNNYLSPGLRGSNIYKAYMSAGSVLNEAQLSFSAFHGAFTSLEAVTSKLALGLYQTMKGDVSGGFKTMGSSPAAFITSAKLGDRFIKEWYSPGSTTPEMAELVDMLKAGGVRPEMQKFMENTATQRMKDTFHSALEEAATNNPIGAGKRLGKSGLLAIRAGIEQAARPILEWLVPRQKMGALAEMARAEIEILKRDNPNYTHEQLRAVMAKITDASDDRFGQMIYDNKFWNGTARDLAHASMRSVGWNVGTASHIGGGLIDWGKFVTKKAAMGKLGEAEVTHKMTYIPALITVAGIAGATFQYIMTGKPPTSINDYFFPQSGGTDENGNPQRYSIPTYMKDVYAYINHFWTTIEHKANPLLGMGGDLLRNKDYWGTEIYHPGDDDYVKNAADIGKYALKNAIPFGIQGFLKQYELGSDWKRMVLPSFGFTPAPADVNKTVAQRMISNIAEANRPMGQRTREQAARYKMISRAARDIRQDKDVSGYLQQAQDDHVIDPGDVNEIIRRSEKTPFLGAFEKLSEEEAARVYKAATPEEKEQVHDLMQDKINNLARRPSLIRSDTEQRIDDLGEDFTGVPDEPPKRQRHAPTRLNVPAGLEGMVNYRTSRSVKMPRRMPSRAR